MKSRKLYFFISGLILLGLVSANVLMGKAVKKKRFGQISGKVVDFEQRLPLAGVAVKLLGTEQRQISDPEGRFRFEQVPVGHYSLEFQLEGLRPQVMGDLIVKSMQICVVNFKMPLRTTVEETVTVQPSYFADTDTGTRNTVGFSNEEIRRAPGTGGDINRLISALPSVAQVDDQGSHLLVRGGSSNENLFLVDQIPVPNINHFPFQGVGGGAISILNVDLIDDVEFMAGAFPVIYGDKLSSVMNVRLREGNRERLSGQFTLDFSGAGLNAEIPVFKSDTGLSRGSWLVSARRSYLDLLNNILETGADVQYSDLLVKGSYDVSDRSKIGLLALWGQDRSRVDREAAIENGETLFGDSNNSELTVGVSWFQIWGKLGYSSSSISFTRTRYKYRFHKTAMATDFLDNRSLDEVLHLRNSNHFTLGGSDRVTFGFGIDLLGSRYDYRSAPHSNAYGQAVPEVRKNIGSEGSKAHLFIDYSAQIGSSISLKLGIRGDYFSYSRSVRVSPRFSAAFRINDRARISFAAGYFRQTLPLLLLYQNPDNRTLTEPLAYQYSAGLDYRFSESVKLKVSGYYKDYRHLPLDPSQPSLCLLDDMFGFSLFRDMALSDQGRGASYGIEMTLQKKMKKGFYGMVNASLFRTRYRDLAGKWHARAFDNRFLFSAQGGIKLGVHWDISLKMSVAGGRPYTPFNESLSTELNSAVFDFSRVNEKRLPIYQRLDIRVDRRFYFNKTNLTVYLSVWNLYNRKNVARYYWNEIRNQPEFSHQFGILPVFGIEFEF